jgi:hypothetical protein
MKTLGKIFLFIGGLLFFVSAIVNLVDLISTSVKAPATYFGTSPVTTGIIALSIIILWIVFDLLSGWSGMTYAVSNKNRGWVRAMVILILVLLIVGIVNAIITEINSKSFVWKDWSALVYGGIAGVFYALGYLMDAKKKN